MFKNWDGTVLSAQQLAYNAAVTPPAAPTRSHDQPKLCMYQFAGWDKEVVNCTGNATYTAIFKVVYVDYTVVFKDWNGTVLSSKTYHYGDAVAAPSDPKRPSDSRKQYVFSGWDKTVVNCVGDATYTAVYLAKSLLPDTITSSKYSVSGGVISKVSAGTKAGDFVKNLNEGAYVKIYTDSNHYLMDRTLVGTGMIAKIVDITEVVASATIVVTGDVNGDGKITITDMLAIKSHLLKKSTLQGAAAQAGDTSGDNVLSITDFIQMKAHILGKSTVQPQIVRAVSTSSQTTSEPALTTLSYTQVDIIIPDRKASLAV